MKVSQLERFYKDGMERLKEQAKKQDQERFNQSVRRAVQQQVHLYEAWLQDTENKLQDTENKFQDTRSKLQDAQTRLRDTENRLQDAQTQRREEGKALRRELRLAQEELERIADQAVSLRKHIEEIQRKKHDPRERQI